MTADKNRARKRNSLVEKYAGAALTGIMAGNFVNRETGKASSSESIISSALWYAERMADAVLKRKEKGR